MPRKVTSNIDAERGKKIYEIVKFLPDKLPVSFRTLSRSKDQTAVWLQIKDMKPGDVMSSTFPSHDQARATQAVIAELAPKLSWHSARSFATMKNKKRLPKTINAVYTTNIVKTTSVTYKLYLALEKNEQ